MKKSEKRNADSGDDTHPKKRKRKAKKDKLDRGITREAAAAAAAALVPDYDGSMHYQPNSESSNSPINTKGELDDDFDYGALIEEEDKPKEKKQRGRGRAPRVPATVRIYKLDYLVLHLTPC